MLTQEKYMIVVIGLMLFVIAFLCAAIWGGDIDASYLRELVRG